MTTYGDGVFQYGGVPVAGALHANPWSTAYFVDGIDGTASAGGLKPDKAVDTVSAAISLASAGDVIYIRQLAPKADATDPTPYTDNWLIPYAKWGMSIVGTGNNPHNPFYCQVKPGTAGYGVEIKAPSTTIENIDFNRGSATTGVIFFSGDVNTTDMAWGCLISNCHIRNADSAAANAGIKTYAGSYNTVYHSFFTGCHTSIYINSGGTYPVRAFTVDRCTFHPGNATLAGGSDIHVGGGSVVYELEIKNCNFTMLPTGKFINIGSGTYGVIQNCYFGDLDTTVGTSASDVIVPTTVFVSGCYDDDADQIASS